MSLLNEMLKDLNGNKVKLSPQPVYIPPIEPSILEKIKWLAPWGIGFFALSLLALMINHRTEINTIKTLPVAHEEQSPVASGAIYQGIASITKSSLEKLIAIQKTNSRFVFNSQVPAIPDAEDVGEGGGDEEIFDQDVPDATPDPLLEASDDPLDNSLHGQIKSSITSGGKDWQDEKLNQALEAVQNGDDKHATKMLEQILHRFPDSKEARESIAAVYIAHGQYAQALKTLDEGLMYSPNSFTLMTMKARALFEENKPQQAYQLIHKFQPDMQTNSDFYGLYAAILQSLGQSNEAGAIYKALVEVDPTNGQYWLGYGIALEARKAVSQAGSAYQRAINAYDVDPTVRAFAESRLKNLQG